MNTTKSCSDRLLKVGEVQKVEGKSFHKYAEGGLAMRLPWSPTVAGPSAGQGVSCGQHRAFLSILGSHFLRMWAGL